MPTKDYLGSQVVASSSPATEIAENAQNLGSAPLESAPTGLSPSSHGIAPTDVFDLESFNPCRPPSRALSGIQTRTMANAPSTPLPPMSRTTLGVIVRPAPKLRLCNHLYMVAYPIWTMKMMMHPRVAQTMPEPCNLTSPTPHRSMICGSTPGPQGQIRVTLDRSLPTLIEVSAGFDSSARKTRLLCTVIK